MKMVKTLKDCKLTHKQQVFAGYIKDKVDSYVCYTPITNRAYMRQFFAPDNDLLIYTTAVAAPPQTLLRGCGGYKQA